MKKIMWCFLAVFIALSVFLYINRDHITFQPWITEQELEYPGYASGNGERTAIITDSAQSIVVLNENGELVYTLYAGNAVHSFVSVELLELDSNNNLYVHDKRFGGVHEENTERILKYSSDGIFLGVVFELTYQNNDFLTTRSNISAMVSIGETLYIVRIEQDRFLLEQVFYGHIVDRRVHAVVSYPNAFRDLLHCRINAITRTIVWTTKTGDILQYNFSGTLLREITADDEMVAFMALSDDDGNLVYTDVTNEKIVSMDQTGERKVLFDSSMSDDGIYFHIHFKNNKIYASFNWINVLVINDDDTFMIINSWLWSKNDINKRYALFILCVITAILFMILFVRCILLFKKLKTTPVFRQIVLVGICIIFGAGISSVIIMGEMQNRYIDNTYNELENISKLISASVDVGIFGRLHSRQQFNDEEYINLSNHIKTVFSGLQFNGKQVYLIIWMERDGIVYSMYDLEYMWGMFYPYMAYEGSFLENLNLSGEYDRATVSDPTGTWVAVSGPIYDNDGKFLAAIETGYNIRTVENENREMIMQVVLIVLATTIAFLLIVIECLLMFDAYKKNKNEITGNSVTEIKPQALKSIIALLANAYQFKRYTISPKYSRTIIGNLVRSYKTVSEKSFHPELLRAAAFFMFFSLNFASAILPLYAAELYVPVLHLPREFIITLPFIALSVFMVISLLLLPGIIGKTGVRRISLISAVLFLIGSILCIIADNVIFLSAGYALLGLTCGTFTLIYNTIIGSQKNAIDVNSGFAHISASYLAGMNVGVVFGAMIAQFFPYRTVFWFASGIALLFMVIIIFSLRSELFNHYYQVNYIKEQDTKKFALTKFLFKPVVLCILLLALMPYVVSINFMEYFMPVFGTENGLGEANIGQLMLLNGLFAILFGASLCKLVSKKVPILLSIIIPLLLDAGALFVFSLNVSISMLIITVVILAIVNIFALTNIQTYFTILYQNENINSAKVLSAYSVVENLSMAAGPVVFSYILANDIGIGMKTLSIAILGCTVVFAIVSNLSVKWNYKTLEKIKQ